MSEPINSVLGIAVENCYEDGLKGERLDSRKPASFSHPSKGPVKRAVVKRNSVMMKTGQVCEKAHKREKQKGLL